MNRLSSPDSVIEKIAEVHRKIEELYETVDLIRQLREKFEVSREKTAAHEARLQEKLIEYDDLGAEYDRTVHRIDQLGDRLESELGRMLTEFGHEKDRVREVMKGFDSERTELRRRFERLDREYTEAMRDTGNHMAYLTRRLESAVDEIRHRVVQEMDENRRWLEGETARLGDVSDRMQEEADFQKENLDLFKDRIEALLDERTEALSHKHTAHADRMGTAFQQLEDAMAGFRDQIEGRLDERTDALSAKHDDHANRMAAEFRRLEEAMAGFRDRIDTTLQDRTDELFEQQDLYKQSTTFDLNARFTEESKTLTDRADGEVQTLRERFGAEKDRIDAALSFLAEERAAVDRRHEAIDQEMTRIDAAVESLIQSARDRVDRTIDDGNAVIEGQVAHVTGFIADSEGEIQRIKGDLKAFKNRLSTNLEGEAAGLRKQLADFQQTAEQELNARLSEDSKQLRMTANREIQALAAERKEITEMHQTLEDALARVNQKIGAKSSYFSSQLNQLIVKSQREITQLGESATVEVRERLDGMTDFAEESREALHALKNRIQEFVGRAREKIDRDTAALHQGQSEFKKKAVQKISAKLSDEVRKLRAANEAALEARITRLTEDHRRISDGIDARLQAFEERIAASEAAVEKERAAIGNQNAKVRDHLKRFSETQTSHTRTLPALVDRISALEDQLEEIGQRRGLFNFPKNPKTKNPAKE
ncbi:MAG: hypothetical protein ACLFQY_13095 [Desulfococcaceae bacterium]